MASLINAGPDTDAGADSKPPATAATAGAGEAEIGGHRDGGGLLDDVTQSLAPSHIVQDGRFIYLPKPDRRERNLFFERSIARHGLLEADLAGKKVDRQRAEDDDGAGAGDDDDKKKKKDSEPKVHPLALASARLQADGINELNRAINLSMLTSTGEYFGLTNIVDPSAIGAAAAASAATAASAAADGAAAAAAAPAAGAAAAAGAGGAGAGGASGGAGGVGAAQSESEMEMQEEQRTKAAYVLKRKRVHFERAATVLGRHRRRLAAAAVAQARPDRRLRRLRPQWRLAAPEHGTRALPHAARPTEVVACDVDVYWKGGEAGGGLGRLAKRVPRYATMELKDNYSVQSDLAEWNKAHFPASEGEGDAANKANNSEEKENAAGSGQPGTSCCTRAEPFAIADPTLGKLDADFDPKKVAMLTLQFDIEKPSTGFSQTASLQPTETLSQSERDSEWSYEADERVLVALQHSLFCAKLFESIRRELAPDTEEVGQIRTTAKAQSVVWLSGESEENFLPPPVNMSGDPRSGLPPLAVVHCHEGEVKVQLDCEYTLRVRLVEAGAPAGAAASPNSGANGTDGGTPPGAPVADSGSQTPGRLLGLCRALLLHAQDAYHKHSLRVAAVLQKQEEEDLEIAKKFTYPHQQQVHARREDEELIPSPRILQACVGLGAKMLFERRIRKTIADVNVWLRSVCGTDERLLAEWLSLGVFDPHAQFALSFRSWSADAHIACEELTVTRFSVPGGGDGTATGGGGEYRKVKFHSSAEFELYLKMSLRRLLRLSSLVPQQQPVF